MASTTAASAAISMISETGEARMLPISSDRRSIVKLRWLLISRIPIAKRPANMIPIAVSSRTRARIVRKAMPSAVITAAAAAPSVIAIALPPSTSAVAAPASCVCATASPRNASPLSTT